MTDLPPEDPNRARIDYTQRYANRRGTPVWAQALLGFFSWYVGIGIVVAVSFEGAKLQIATMIIQLTYVACIAGLIFLAIFAHVRGWKVFIPALIVGMAVSCLLFPFVCAYVVTRGL